MHNADDCEYCLAIAEFLNEYILDKLPLADVAEYAAQQIETYLREQE